MNSSTTNKFRSSRIAETHLWRCGETESWEPPCAPHDLPETGAHVWLCPLTSDIDLASFISPEEAERAENFLPESKANEFRQSRGWLRMLLAYYANLTEPGSIRLGISQSGKPYAADYPALRFNLSHSYGWAAIAFSRREVGIDIEKLRPVPDWRMLAEGLLTTTTVRGIAGLSAAAQDRAFLAAFTAHEGHMKALGKGVGAASVRRLPEIPGYVGHVCILGSGES